MRTINELACAGALLLLAFALCVARLHDMIGDELFVVASSIAGGIVFCVAHTRRLRLASLLSPLAIQVAAAYAGPSVLSACALFGASLAAIPIGRAHRRFESYLIVASATVIALGWSLLSGADKPAIALTFCSVCVAAFGFVAASRTANVGVAAAVAVGVQTIFLAVLLPVGFDVHLWAGLMLLVALQAGLSSMLDGPGKLLRAASALILAAAIAGEVSVSFGSASALTMTLFTVAAALAYAGRSESGVRLAAAVTGACGVFKLVFYDWPDLGGPVRVAILFVAAGVLLAVPILSGTLRASDAT